MKDQVDLSSSYPLSLPLCSSSPLLVGECGRVHSSHTHSRTQSTWSLTLVAHEVYLTFRLLTHLLLLCSLVSVHLCVNVRFQPRFILLTDFCIKIYSDLHIHGTMHLMSPSSIIILIYSYSLLPLTHHFPFLLNLISLFFPTVPLAFLPLPSLPYFPFVPFLVPSLSFPSSNVTFTELKMQNNLHGTQELPPQP